MQDRFLIHRAIEFATVRHNGQKRKGTVIPYIVHPIEVMQILTAEGCSDEMIAAGILHDTVEDTDTTIEEITEYFGENVARIVAAESEDKSKSWEERKQTTIDHLKDCDKEIVLCLLADKLSNLMSIHYDFLKIGQKIWERFNKSYEKEKWYYIEIRNATAKYSNSVIWKRYSELCDVLFGGNK